MRKKPLFIFEMANNHQGSVAHGKRIVAAMRKSAAPFADRFRFACKFQYRDLDFIHPAARGRADIKNVKRFEETRLTREDFGELLACVRDNGFLAVCTPFDEPSARRMQEEGYDYLKIASCSFGDWPLLEAVAATGLPVIASAAGSALETMRNVVSFFQHRKIPVGLMHCIGEYPTADTSMQMNQIDLFRQEFPGVPIGFSTHEAPGNYEPVKIAVAKGARIFEKHVGVETQGITLNAYSANPEQVAGWLEAAAVAYTLCGQECGRPEPSERERTDLAALRRGLFAKTDLPAGSVLDAANSYLAFPCREGQIVAQNMSKYTRFILKEALAADEAVLLTQVESDTSVRHLVVNYVERVVALLKESNAVIPQDSECELSHHYGIEKFSEFGLVLINCVNREYCKKLLVLLPGQENPQHYHVKKEETFIVLHGDLTVSMGGENRVLARGDTMTVERGAAHSFSSATGCVFEEISSTHCPGDSFYEAQATFVSPRKTQVFLTSDVLIRG